MTRSGRQLNTTEHMKKLLTLSNNLLVNCGWGRQKAAPLPIRWGEGKFLGNRIDSNLSKADAPSSFPSLHPMGRGLGRGALCTRFMAPMRAPFAWRLPMNLKVGRRSCAASLKITRLTRRRSNAALPVKWFMGSMREILFRRSLSLALLLAPAILAQLPPGNDKGVAMGHLHLRVSDLDAHKKLWIDALGAKVVKLGRLEACQFPGVQVLLTKGAPTGGTDGCVVDHLGFKVKSLDEAKSKLTAAGGKFLTENPKTRQMFIEFPDGIKIEFTENKEQTDPVVHDHIHFAVQEIDEQRAWYAKMFGALPGTSGPFKAADVPGVNLRWKPAEAKLPGTKGRGVDHIGFEIANLEAFCKKLEADGVKFDRPYSAFPQMGLSIAFLTDPWGVYIELTEGLVKMK